MNEKPASASLFRERSEHQHHRVTFVELFFDLVFVFAVTQLSHKLLHHFTLGSVLETALLMFAVWWVWVYTSWITNWLDPERAPVRLMLFALMLGGLALSTSIPEAFAERGLTFAVAYCLMQLGRTLFMVFSIPRSDVALRRNFQRVLAWLLLAAPFWLLGAFFEGGARLALWGMAIAIEYLSPAVRFWVPGLGASSLSDWSVEGGHLAERCSLFIIIALGESVLVTGATFAETEWNGATVSAFLAAFVGSVAMWWIHFDSGAEVGAERMARSQKPGQLARLAYTYLHSFIVAGVVLSAVADELVLAHPTGHTELATAVASLGGPWLFLVGVLCFKRAIRGWFQLSHLVGIGFLSLLAPFSMACSPLTLSLLGSGVLVLVAVWESLSLGGSGKAVAHTQAEHRT